MKSGTILRGKFQPVNVADLTQPAIDLIGSRHYFRVLYLIEGGEYQYRYACEPIDCYGNVTGILGPVWVPDCDIMIEEIDISLPERMTA